jgi:tripartite-type tricarboxylate transporter receptor subunit TctC
MMIRQAIICAIGALALAMTGASPATAQAYPSRPVTIIVPFAAGGTTDVIARILGEHMSRTFGQQFIVENVVGAGGTTGSIRAMRANPDGYTIEFPTWERMRLRWRSIPASRTTRKSISRRSAWSPAFRS